MKWIVKLTSIRHHNEIIEIEADTQEEAEELADDGEGRVISQDEYGDTQHREIFSCKPRRADCKDDEIGMFGDN